MKTIEEWAKLFEDGRNLNVWNHHKETISEIQQDSYQEGFKAGVETTMRWVSDECKRQTAKLMEKSLAIESGVKKVLTNE